ncbi:hypothetical protein B0H14DRAFT_2578555 [Mycena olivaceomarginata]|nr:hypothetical protein B0H14DRAFT_2578555 [Mycena olivaceomarginata]
MYQPGNQRLVLDRIIPSANWRTTRFWSRSLLRECHSDVELLTGVSLDARKYVFGHESCGYPVKLGSKVDTEAVQIGKLYSILPVDSCTHGVQGGPRTLQRTGNRQGWCLCGLHDRHSRHPRPVPEGVAPEVAAIAADAGVTSYRAVQRAAQVKPGDKVLIFGIGGLGHLALQYAKHFGATVYACDFKPEARKLALELGAVAAFDLIELSNMTAATNPRTSASRPNDVNFPVKPKCVMVGVSAENLVFNTLDTITTGVQILGSTGGEQDDLAAVWISLPSSEPLENINKVLDELRASAYTGRKVVIPHPTA